MTDSFHFIERKSYVAHAAIPLFVARVKGIKSGPGRCVCVCVFHYVPVLQFLSMNTMDGSNLIHLDHYEAR